MFPNKYRVADPAITSSGLRPDRAETLRRRLDITISVNRVASRVERDDECESEKQRNALRLANGPCVITRRRACFSQDAMPMAIAATARPISGAPSAFAT